MKILFLSNYMNHHQLPLSDALYRNTGGGYTFVTTTSMPKMRKELGYPEIQRDYILPLEGNELRVRQMLREADVVIAGSAPEWLLRQRIRHGKLLLRYAERPLKNGPEPIKYLPRLLRWHWRNPPGKPIYMLCASAYTVGDYRKFGLFRGCSFRWGYFPEERHYDIQALLSAKDPAEILWCGRFLLYKHPETAVLAAQMLKQKGYRFRLRFIGTGQMEPQLRSLVRDMGLENYVHFSGTMGPDRVRNAMEHAGIFLFTSDRGEGWGAVVNEAMNSGCAVLASHAAGSVPFLIKDAENGLIYPSEDRKALCDKLRYLLDHPAEQRRLGAEAYVTIRKSWNPETAADRLIQLSRYLINGENTPELFADGPCSRAEPLEESWFV